VRVAVVRGGGVAGISTRNAITTSRSAALQAPYTHSEMLGEQSSDLGPQLLALRMDGEASPCCHL